MKLKKKKKILSRYDKQYNDTHGSLARARLQQYDDIISKGYFVRGGGDGIEFFISTHTRTYVKVYYTHVL